MCSATLIFQNLSQERKPTPVLSHITEKDLENVYEPAEDSFLFMDALNLDEQFLFSLKPLTVLEIGYVFPTVQNPKWIFERDSTGVDLVA